MILICKHFFLAAHAFSWIWSMKMLLAIDCGVDVVDAWRKKTHIVVRCVYFIWLKGIIIAAMHWRMDDILQYQIFMIFLFIRFSRFLLSCALSLIGSGILSEYLVWCNLCRPKSFIFIFVYIECAPGTESDCEIWSSWQMQGTLSMYSYFSRSAPS